MSAHTFGVSTWIEAGLPSGWESPPNDNKEGQVLLFKDEKDGRGPFRRVISHAGLAQFRMPIQLAFSWVDMDARDWRLAIEECRLVD